MASMQSVMTRAVATLAVLLLALPLPDCSMNLNWDSDKSDKPPQAAQDDSTCQSAGYTFGTPEYQQCLQNLAQQRAVAERADVRPYYGLQR
jgi:hypothetical protein